MKNNTLTVLGCGNMAQAIIRALASDKNAAGVKITVSDLDTSKFASLPEGVESTCDNAYAVSKSDCVLLAVKPQSAPEMLASLDLSDKLIISIMAGVTVDTLSRLTGSGKIVRVMPNLNARIYRSYNAYTTRGISVDEKKFAEKLLSSFGEACEVKESDLDAVTGLTGSSPAFVFMLIESFTESGVKLGFDYATARNMALAAVIGSAELVKSSPELGLCEMIDSVCSKGGTTIEGVKYLRESKFEEIASEAVMRAVKRSEELSAAK